MTRCFRMGPETMYGLEFVGHQWATQGVFFGDIGAARACAKASVLDCIEIRVWDCTTSPAGVLVEVYRR